MKFKTQIILTQEEMNAIQKTIELIGKMSDGEIMIMNELLCEDGYCQLDDVGNCLVELREMSEVEKECPRIF